MLERGTVTIIEGNIGVGKSTFARALAAALGPETLLHMEPDDEGDKNPYLADYYADPKRWGFTLQVHQLALRFSAHVYANQHASCAGHHAVLDRSYFGDTCFARMLAKAGTMLPKEYDSYESIYHEMTKFVLLPNFCIRLEAEPSVCARRIQKRLEGRPGRKCEGVIDLAYLKALDDEIDFTVSVLESHGVATIRLNWNEEADSTKIFEKAKAVAEIIRENQRPSLLRCHNRQV